VIIDDDTSPEEIFRAIKNGDCAIFEFFEWLSLCETVAYNEGFCDAQDQEPEEDSEK
jgi:hypothetical protein